MIVIEKDLLCVEGYYFYGFFRVLFFCSGIFWIFANLWQKILGSCDLWRWGRWREEPGRVGERGGMESGSWREGNIYDHINDPTDSMTFDTMTTNDHR